MIDNFFIENSVNKNKIQSIKIGHDGGKMASAWELEAVTVESPNGNETYIFTFKFRRLQNILNSNFLAGKIG